MPGSPTTMLLGPLRPPPLVRVAFAAAAVALTTLLLYPLREVAPAAALGVVYLIAVLLVSAVGGLWLGVATGVASAAAFNFFHIPPTGRFTIADGENWVALAVFLASAVLASSLAELARTRAIEAERRRREADLAAELARTLLGTADVRKALGPAAQRIANELQLRSAAIELGPPTVRLDESRYRRITVADPEGRRIGSLLVPGDVPEDTARALQERLGPALAALLNAALEREKLTREVVETSALRRSDEIKTALLRAVSHDLRSPLTTIVAAADALASPAVDDEDRRELADAIAKDASRLAALVDKLLDLSRLESGAAEPRRDWCSIEDVIRAAAGHAPGGHQRVKLVIDPDLPLIEADDAQLERAFANLIENGLRHSDEPISVRARVTGGKLRVRVVDHGPGISPAEQERIFEPFYRAADGSGGGGSGLGLAIVRGFVEANGGSVHVESLPGQGTSFVVELPLQKAPA